ncbi:MAG TPA: NHL repeat-containing protein [Anaeromyxobacteraceae bacterium]|nr:NHL repeat-containing protein [Anaeromyxobacteraceae bacterium]
MTTLRPKLLLLGSLWLATPATTRAANFKHVGSIYADDKEGPLRAPEGVACDDKGALVVADTGNARLLTYGFRDGKATGGAPVRLPQATYPVRVQIDRKGNVLVLDRKTRKIVRVDGAGGYGGAIEVKGASGATPILPLAFKVDLADRLYVLDAGERRVLVLEPDGKVVREVALPRGEQEFTDVAVGPTGKLFAMDSTAARLWVADPAARSFQPVGESLKDRISFPTYVTSDGRGRLYVVDQHGNAIVALGEDGSFQGRELSMGWSDGSLYYPVQLCVNGEGLAFVADRNNNRVQVFSLSR